jgi:DNA-binding GntR family transcriptional regulator
VQSTRELALSLGCSKSALAEALAKLESEGVLVRVVASHGKGSAIRPLGEMAA